MTPYMSKIELDLIQADNISLVRYYTLPDGTQGLLLIYSGKKFINLCEYDDGWLLLTRRADSLYLEFPDICADDHTRDILERRKNAHSPKRFGFITEARPHAEKAVSYVGAAFSENFIGYFLSQIYQSIGAEFALIGIKGYRENYSIRCRVNGKETSLPCGFTARQNEYGYRLGNIFSPLHSAYVKLIYEYSSIRIIADIKTERALRQEYCYDFSENKLMHRIMEDGQIIFFDEQPLNMPAVRISDRLRLICGLKDELCDGYILPWNEKIFYREDHPVSELISENTSGRSIQIYREQLGGNEADKIYAAHEIFEHHENILIQSELWYDSTFRCPQSIRQGFYYRYIGRSGLENISADLSDMTSAQITRKYLHER